MTTITHLISDATLRSSLQALRQTDGPAEAIADLAFALDPPEVWVLTCGTDRHGYSMFLGRDRDTEPLEFGAPAGALLFSAAEKASFDAQAFVAEHGLDQADDEDAEAGSVAQMLADAEFELAPNVDEVHDSFEIGNTELDFLESLAVLANRALTRSRELAAHA